MEMLEFGHYGYPIIIFPSTKGRYHEAKDFYLIDSVAHLIEEGRIKIFCPDSIDAWSWYNRSIHPADRVKNHMWYDRMIVEEVIGKIEDAHGPTKVAVGGCSFGGYHASNFAFRHPYKVSHLICMSAAFNIKDQMDGYYDENVYLNNPEDFVPKMDHPDLYHMKIVLGTAEHDICKDQNYNMSKILHQKGVDHWLDERPGAVHDWVVWRQMFPDYAALI